MTRAGLALAAVTLASCGAMIPVGAGADGGTRVPCATEDSHPDQGCVWDARHMGNGLGRSFVIQRSGRLVFVSHARAHALLFGGVS